MDGKLITNSLRLFHAESIRGSFLKYIIYDRCMQESKEENTINRRERKTFKVARVRSMILEQ